MISENICFAHRGLFIVCEEDKQMTEPLAPILVLRRELIQEFVGEPINTWRQVPTVSSRRYLLITCVTLVWQDRQPENNGVDNENPKDVPLK